MAATLKTHVTGGLQGLADMLPSNLVGGGGGGAASTTTTTSKEPGTVPPPPCALCAAESFYGLPSTKLYRSVPEPAGNQVLHPELLPPRQCLHWPSSPSKGKGKAPLPNPRSSCRGPSRMLGSGDSSTQEPSQRRVRFKGAKGVVSTPRAGSPTRPLAPDSAIDIANPYLRRGSSTVGLSWEHSPSPNAVARLNSHQLKAALEEFQAGVAKGPGGGTTTKKQEKGPGGTTKEQLEKGEPARKVGEKKTEDSDGKRNNKDATRAGQSDAPTVADSSSNWGTCAIDEESTTPVPKHGTTRQQPETVPTPSSPECNFAKLSPEQYPMPHAASWVWKRKSDITTTLQHDVAFIRQELEGAQRLEAMLHGPMTYRPKMRVAIAGLHDPEAAQDFITLPDAMKRGAREKGPPRNKHWLHQQVVKLTAKEEEGRGGAERGTRETSVQKPAHRAVERVKDTGKGTAGHARPRRLPHHHPQQTLHARNNHKAAVHVRPKLVRRQEATGEVPKYKKKVVAVADNSSDDGCAIESDDEDEDDQPQPTSRPPHGAPSKSVGDHNTQRTRRSPREQEALLEAQVRSCLQSDSSRLLEAQLCRHIRGNPQRTDLGAARCMRPDPVEDRAPNPDRMMRYAEELADSHLGRWW